MSDFYGVEAPPGIPGGMDWIQKQVPPQDPSQSGLHGLLWRALGIPTPPWVASTLGKIPGYPQAPAVPKAPAAPVTPAPPVLESPGTPRIPEKEDRGPQKFSIPSGPEPKPPQLLPEAPHQAQVPPTDFSSYTKLLEAEKPEEGERLGAVLGGLAKGVSEVKANEPGSFARALAAWGAGGMAGLQSQHALEREYATKRAGAELNMLNIKHNQDVSNAEVAFQNASGDYKRDTENIRTMNEFQEKKEGREAPKIHVDPNGVTTSQINPDTKQTDIQYFPTRDVQEKAEKLYQIQKALGAGNPTAEAAAFQVTHKQMQSMPPEVRQAALTQIAVNRIIHSGAGPQVFGDAYTKALQEAATQLSAEGLDAEKFQKPEDYHTHLMNRVAAMFMSHPEVRSAEFYKRAAPHSITACILSGAKSAGDCMAAQGVRQEDLE